MVRHVLVALLLAVVAATPSSALAVESDRDPRNWPPVPRLIADRFELAGQVLTLRVHARQSSFYGCGYRGQRGRVMAFTLMAGPLETLTGYVPADLGKVLARQLEEEPWMPITVEVRFDPDRLSEICPDQVEVLKWSNGWRYPPGSLSPGRPDPIHHPTREIIGRAGQKAVWAGLTGKRPRSHKGGPPLTEEALLGETIDLAAGARLSTAYLCSFRSATRTHFALRLHDGKGSFVHGYVSRDTPGAAELADLVGLHRDVLVVATGRVVKQIPSNYCRPQIEITSWSVGEAQPEGLRPLPAR